MASTHNTMSQPVQRTVRVSFTATGPPILPCPKPMWDGSIMLPWPGLSSRERRLPVRLRTAPPLPPWHRRAGGALVVLDVDCRAYSWASPAEAAQICDQAAAAADIIVGNDDEFGVLAGGHDRGQTFSGPRAKAISMQRSRMFSRSGPGNK